MVPEATPPPAHRPSEETTGELEFTGAAPGTVIGPYRLVGKLGEGGMGVVYQAYQTQPIHRVVALKIIKPDLDSQNVVSRFESERQALALMDHTNIARVFDAGDHWERAARISPWSWWTGRRSRRIATRNA